MSDDGERRNQRLNATAKAIEHAWGDWLPLSVRYGAAEAALAVIERWDSTRPPSEAG